MTINFQKALLLICLTLMTLDRVSALESDNVIGKKFTIESTILEDKRDIQIFFPPSYDSSEKEYPVLYILDGQRLHTLGVSLSQSLTGRADMTPEFIVVGINNKYPDRFSHFSKTKFLEFIEKELVVHVDKHYRTTKERIAFGWEFAGAYVIQSFVNKPHLFSGHIAASPYPITQSWITNKAGEQQIKQRLKSDAKSHLYFTVSESEGTVNAGTEQLNTLLKDEAPQSLNWQYRVIADEQHNSTAHASLFQGLMHYFYGYEVFHIEGLTKFEQAGGLDNFYAYNKLRANKYGFAEQPDPWSMFTIVRNAMRAEDFEKFHQFVQEFASTNMLKKIRLSRAISIAKYYINHKHYDRALRIYQTLSKEHKGNARIQKEIAETYRAKNQKNKAKEYYLNAVKFAEASGDKMLEEYRKNLAEL